MNMTSVHSAVNGVIKDVMKQKEAIILDQLGDLVKRGLLVIEETEPVIVQSTIADKFELRQIVRITLKDKEYVESLEKKLRIAEQRANQIDIGQYTIRPRKTYDNRSAFWIEHESGEGMECSADSLASLITKFYTDNF